LTNGDLRRAYMASIGSRRPSPSGYDTDHGTKTTSNLQGQV
jgi:hypothetical protein